jgi:hypothetical protein
LANFTKIPPARERGNTSGCFLQTLTAAMMAATERAMGNACGLAPNEEMMLVGGRYVVISLGCRDLFRRKNISAFLFACTQTAASTAAGKRATG